MVKIKKRQLKIAAVNESRMEIVVKIRYIGME